MVAVPAHGMATLQPGSFHVMMMGLAKPLEEGHSFPLTLTFEQAGEVTVEVTVQGVGSMGGMDTPAATMDHGTMDHGTMDNGNMPAAN